MNKIDIVNQLLQDQSHTARQDQASVYAPTNIALSKYWGKRNQQLHLPMNSSVSLTLNQYGCDSTLSIIDSDQDIMLVNGDRIDTNTSFYKKASAFLDLFRFSSNYHFQLDTQSRIPIAAGLASSACGFAAIVKALDSLFAWQLPTTQLSILARLGSGSACRSLYNGFAVWHKGQRDDGMDSVAEAIDSDWPEFCMGAVLLSKKQKPISSRQGMQHTVDTSSLYAAWPEKAETDCRAMIKAIKEKHFSRLASLAENNALFMHATMQAAQPPVNYWLPESVALMQKVWRLRREGLAIYFTMDAGPNIKLLYLKHDHDTVSEHFTLALHNNLD